MPTYSNQATPEEIQQYKASCYHPGCKKVSLIEDHGGWKWCIKHYWWQRDGYFSKMRKIIWSNVWLALHPKI